MLAGQATLHGEWPSLRMAGLVGDGLGRIFLDGLSLSQAAVEAVVDLYGADLGAVTAVVADQLVDVPGLLSQPRFEVARRAFQFLQFGEGVNFDVGIPGTLHQLRRDDAGRAIPRGKGFVQVGHHAADGSRALYEMNLEPGIGQIQGSLDAGDTSPLNEDGPIFLFLRLP